MAQLVGIINLTPDSFSDGGLYNSTKAAVSRATELIDEGAALLDIGAESTRPNAQKLTSEQEWQRLEPVLRELLREYPGMISLDTYHPETVIRAFEIGPVIVNDVTGMNNPDMADAVIRLGAKCIISHLPTNDIQEAHRLAPVQSGQTVKRDLLARRDLLITRGLMADKIILDPGIGFGKTPEVNRELLRFAQEVPGIDVMIGYSRKRFLGVHRFETGPNLEAGKIAIAAGAKYLRVHDVKAHRLGLGLNKPTTR